MAKKIITIGKKGVTERIEGSGPITNVNVDYPNGNASTELKTPFTERSFIANTANGYNQASPIRINPSGVISPIAFGTAVGTRFEIVAFTPDVPTSLIFSWALGPPLYQGTTLIYNGEANDEIWFHEIPLMQSNFAGGIERIETASFGFPELFETSTGIQFRGYGIKAKVADMGFLSTSGGSAASTEFIFFGAQSQGELNGPGLKDTAKEGVVIVDERDVTQEMIKTGRVEGIFFGDPSRYILAGVYSAIEP
jgi:hypothetical protein